MDINLERLIEYYREEGAVLLLESQSEEHPWSRYSYFAALPETEITARGKEVIIKENNTRHLQSGNPWQHLQEFQEKNDSWLFGYLGYDLKNHTEQLVSQNPDAVGAPDMYFMVPAFLLRIDRLTSSYKVIKGELPDDIPVQGWSSSATFKLDDFKPQLTKQQYISKVTEAKRRIREGDVYEVNLSHQMRGTCYGDPLALYQKMRGAGPVPFGAYLEWQGFSICCQSPERFLLKEGNKITSQPIKGTSRRSNDKRIDTKLKEKLLASQKERAENLMIVDLVRNDLSRIASPGSVQVPALFHIESFRTVHQMVSTITGESTAEPVDILKACFPMGSMTGAPKIRAMQIIEELEGYRRGIYSGAIGYISPQKNFDFNVVIRTAIIKNEQLFYAVGGAITSDSDPEREWEETLIKARALTEIDSPQKDK